MALHSFFGARGIGANDTRALVFKNKFYFDDVTKKKKGFLRDPKTHIGEFF